MIACDSDEVDSLVPPGVDPHDYELRPPDVRKLASADVIVSTAHAPFEKVIREEVLRGEVRALLVEIPRIEGVELRENPVTRQPNYHMPIYDPQNYLAFMRCMRDLLSELNPDCASTYERRYEDVEARVLSLVEGTPKVNVTAIACLLYTSPSPRDRG